jgi:hypothetical protein
MGSTNIYDLGTDVPCIMHTQMPPYLLFLIVNLFQIINYLLLTITY